MLIKIYIKNKKTYKKEGDLLKNSYFCKKNYKNGRTQI